MPDQSMPMMPHKAAVRCATICCESTDIGITSTQNALFLQEEDFTVVCNALPWKNGEGNDRDMLVNPTTSISRMLDANLQQNIHGSTRKIAICSGKLQSSYDDDGTVHMYWPCNDRLGLSLRNAYNKEIGRAMTAAMLEMPSLCESKQGGGRKGKE